LRESSYFCPEGAFWALLQQYMDTQDEFGQFSRSFITDVPADLNSPLAQQCKATIPRFPDEAVYIYSFKEGRMLYADGWKPILGYHDDEINMLAIVNMSAPKFAPFSHELNDKALQFILKQQENLHEYSFRIELKKIHKDRHEVPIVARVGVHGVEQGRVVSIIGNFRVDHTLRFGNVMRYAAYGPEKNLFEEELNKTLFSSPAISDKEKDVLALVATGLSFREVAQKLLISYSTAEKRIHSLYKRFNVNSLPHLISFAYDNHILP
jgi:DNA-binding CsgD family transcriptional regulator